MSTEESDNDVCIVCAFPSNDLNDESECPACEMERETREEDQDE